MSEVLSQKEIDRMLTAIGNTESEDFRAVSGSKKLTQEEKEKIDRLLARIDDVLPDSLDGSVNSFENIEAFEKYLLKHEFVPEEPYGIFDKDISVCRFFDSGKNENLLEDIKRKNEEQGYGNIKIPNTNITLINYSFCSTCKTIFSFKEVIDYYKNPKPDQRYKSKVCQHREDTRVYCNNCGAYFLPSLIYSRFMGKVTVLSPLHSGKYLIANNPDVFRNFYIKQVFTYFIIM
jgi:hypothetical protein